MHYTRPASNWLPPFFKRPQGHYRCGTVSSLYDYLGYLAKHHHVIGGSENEVASYLLKLKVTELHQTEFHKLEIPKDGSKR
ncbi:MAG: hypothetical protein ACLQF1_20695 [Methyloceanibacter sp.]|jgi:hypothetical protein